jgi:predicted transcriptional regulator
LVTPKDRRPTVVPSTTTLKLAESLKARIAPIAAAAGKTAHAWMVEALEAQVALGEMRESFIAEAQAAADSIDRGGPLYAEEDVRAYIVGLAAGRAGKRPAPLERSRSRGKTRTR